MVLVMPKKIKLIAEGAWVGLTAWEGCSDDGFFHSVQMVGLVLEAELVEMDVNEGEGIHDKHEWMYRVNLTNGIVTLSLIHI